jgi:D-lactate dehydrogenase
MLTPFGFVKTGIHKAIVKGTELANQGVLYPLLGTMAKFFLLGRYIFGFEDYIRSVLANEINRLDAAPAMKQDIIEEFNSIPLAQLLKELLAVLENHANEEEEQEIARIIKEKRLKIMVRYSRNDGIAKFDEEIKASYAQARVTIVDVTQPLDKVSAFMAHFDFMTDPDYISKVTAFDAQARREMAASSSSAVEPKQDPAKNSARKVNQDERIALIQIIVSEIYLRTGKKPLLKTVAMDSRIGLGSGRALGNWARSTGVDLNNLWSNAMGEDVDLDRKVNKQERAKLIVKVVRDLYRKTGKKPLLKTVATDKRIGLGSTSALRQWAMDNGVDLVKLWEEALGKSINLKERVDTYQRKMAILYVVRELYQKTHQSPSLNVVAVDSRVGLSSDRSLSRWARMHHVSLGDLWSRAMGKTIKMGEKVNKDTRIEQIQTIVKEWYVRSGELPPLEVIARKLKLKSAGVLSSWAHRNKVNLSELREKVVIETASSPALINTAVFRQEFILTRPYRLQGRLGLGSNLTAAQRNILQTALQVIWLSFDDSWDEFAVLGWKYTILYDDPVTVYEKETGKVLKDPDFLQGYYVAEHNNKQAFITVGDKAFIDEAQMTVVLMHMFYEILQHIVPANAAKPIEQKGIDAAERTLASIRAVEMNPVFTFKFTQRIAQAKRRIEVIHENWEILQSRRKMFSIENITIGVLLSAAIVYLSPRAYMKLYYSQLKRRGIVLEWATKMQESLKGESKPNQSLILYEEIQYLKNDFDGDVAHYVPLRFQQSVDNSAASSAIESLRVDSRRTFFKAALASILVSPTAVQGAILIMRKAPADQQLQARRFLGLQEDIIGEISQAENALMEEAYRSALENMDPRNRAILARDATRIVIMKSDPKVWYEKLYREPVLYPELLHSITTVAMHESGARIYYVVIDPQSFVDGALLTVDLIYELHLLLFGYVLDVDNKLNPTVKSLISAQQALHSISLIEENNSLGVQYRSRVTQAKKRIEKIRDNFRNADNLNVVAEVIVSAWQKRYETLAMVMLGLSFYFAPAAHLRTYRYLLNKKGFDPAWADQVLAGLKENQATRLGHASVLYDEVRYLRKFDGQPADYQPLYLQSQDVVSSSAITNPAMLNIAIFDAKPYDRKYFEQANAHYGFKITYFEARLTPETVELAKDFNIVVIFVNDKVNAQVIETLHRNGVEMIALRCAGFNNVDVNAATGKIKIARVPAYSPYAVAEHAMALMMTLNRNTHKAHNRVREGNFSIAGLEGFDFHGKTIGVIGTGKIGQVFIDIVKGFGMNVLAYDPYPNQVWAQAAGIHYVDLKTLYQQSDVISLHCPLTPKNKHMINTRAINLMKPGVMLINTGRGGLVDTRALIKGLKSGKIGYVGLDVYEEESGIFFVDHSVDMIKDDVLVRLMTFPNVLITSHQAFLTAEALTNIADTTMENIADFMGGRSLKNEVKGSSAVLTPEILARAERMVAIDIRGIQNELNSRAFQEILIELHHIKTDQALILAIKLIERQLQTVTEEWPFELAMLSGRRVEFYVTLGDITNLEQYLDHYEQSMLLRAKWLAQAKQTKAIPTFKKAAEFYKNLTIGLAILEPTQRFYQIAKRGLGFIAKSGKENEYAAEISAIYYEIGNRYLTDGDHVQALAHLRLAQKYNPKEYAEKLYRIQLEIILSFEDLEKIDQAQSVLDAALLAHPGKDFPMIIWLTQMVRIGQLSEGLARLLRREDASLLERTIVAFAVLEIEEHEKLAAIVPLIVDRDHQGVRFAAIQLSIVIKQELPAAVFAEIENDLEQAQRRLAQLQAALEVTEKKVGRKEADEQQKFLRAAKRDVEKLIFIIVAHSQPAQVTRRVGELLGSTDDMMFLFAVAGLEGRFAKVETAFLIILLQDERIGKKGSIRNALQGEYRRRVTEWLTAQEGIAVLELTPSAKQEGRELFAWIVAVDQPKKLEKMRAQIGLPVSDLARASVIMEQVLTSDDQVVMAALQNLQSEAAGLSGLVSDDDNQASIQAEQELVASLKNQVEQLLAQNRNGEIVQLGQSVLTQLRLVEERIAAAQRRLQDEHDQLAQQLRGRFSNEWFGQLLFDGVIYFTAVASWKPGETDALLKHSADVDRLAHLMAIGFTKHIAGGWFTQWNTAKYLAQALVFQPTGKKAQSRYWKWRDIQKLWQPFVNRPITPQQAQSIQECIVGFSARADRQAILDHVVKENTASSAVNQRAVERFLKDELNVNGSYDVLRDLISPRTAQAVYNDRSLRLVFLAAYREQRGEVGPWQSVDEDVVAGIGGMEVLNAYRGFLIGHMVRAATERKNGRDIIVGITDRPYHSNLFYFPNSNGRQAYFFLEDGTVVGYKGSGNYQHGDRLAMGETIRDFHSYNLDRDRGLLFEGAANAVYAREKLKGTGWFGGQSLGYSFLHVVEEGNGTRTSTAQWVRQPVLTANRFITLHRLHDLPHLLSHDPKLSGFLSRVNPILASMGYPLIADKKDLLFKSLAGVGKNKAIEQNHQLYRISLHVQDVSVVYGQISDGEEVITLEQRQQLFPLRTGVLDVHGFGDLMNILLVLGVSEILDFYYDNYRGMIFGEGIRALFAAYFGNLDTEYLALWADDANLKRGFSESKLEDSNIFNAIKKIISEELERRNVPASSAVNDSYELAPPQSLISPEFISKARFFKDQIAKGVIRTIVIPNWPSDSKRWSTFTRFIESQMKRFGYESIFEHHQIVDDMELLQEVRKWNAPNLFYTVGAQTYTRAEIRSKIIEALYFGATGLFVVSGSGSKRKFFTILVGILRLPEVVIVTLGLSLLAIRLIRQKYLSMDSLSILALIEEMKKMSHVPDHFEVWAAFNPYIDTIEDAEDKIWRGATKLLTQPMILDEYFSSVWEKAQGSEILRGRLAVGYAPMSSAGMLKFFYFLIGIPVSGPAAMAGQAQKLLEQFKSSKTFAKQRNQAVLARSVELSGKAGIHHMMGKDWVMMPEAEESLRKEVRRIAARSVVRVEYGLNSYQVFENLLTLHRALTMIEFLIRQQQIDRTKLQQKVKRFYLLHTLTTNTFQPAVSARRIMGRKNQADVFLGQYDLVIDLRQLKDLSQDQLAQTIMAEYQSVISDQASRPQYRGAIIVEDATPIAQSRILWPFNFAFWRNLMGYQQYKGEDFDASIQGSPASDPKFVRDLPAQTFFVQLKEAVKKDPTAKYYFVEIGTAGAKFVKLFIDALIDIASNDNEFTPADVKKHLVYVMADFSEKVIERAQQSMGQDFHGEHVEYLHLKTADPAQEIRSAYQRGILRIHSTNVYDNLLADRYVRLGNEYYRVDAALYVDGIALHRIAKRFAVNFNELLHRVEVNLHVGKDVERFLEFYQRYFEAKDRATEFFGFWQAFWQSLKMQEELVLIEDLNQEQVIPSIPNSGAVLRQTIEEVKGNIEVTVPVLAIESARKMLGILEPHVGNMELVDIVVRDLREFQEQPRKFAALTYDGSIVHWLNGRLVEAFAAQQFPELHMAVTNLKAYGKPQMSHVMLAPQKQTMVSASSSIYNRHKLLRDRAERDMTEARAQYEEMISKMTYSVGELKSKDANRWRYFVFRLIHLPVYKTSFAAISLGLATFFVEQSFATFSLGRSLVILGMLALLLPIIFEILQGLVNRSVAREAEVRGLYRQVVSFEKRMYQYLKEFYKAKATFVIHQKLLNQYHAELVNGIAVEDIAAILTALATLDYMGDEIIGHDGLYLPKEDEFRLRTAINDGMNYFRIQRKLRDFDEFDLTAEKMMERIFSNILDGDTTQQLEVERGARTD